MGFRQWILKIHLYGGLLCFWYLIIFAVSSLHFHHDFEFMEVSKVSSESRKIILPAKLHETDSARATALQNELGLAGWYLFWKTYTDSTGVFHTEIQNPKTTYTIRYDPAYSTASVTAEYKGFWNIFNALHGFAGKMPNAPLLTLWTFFTYLCLVVVIFSVVSGIWLWSQKREDKVTGWVMVIGIVFLSVTLMVTVYLKG